MKEKSIIFRGDGILAILEGRKINTRRVIKLPGWSTGNWEDFELDDEGNPMIIARETGCLAAIHCPYGQPGDRLWVRETWASMCRVADPFCICDEEGAKVNHYIEYKADTDNPLPGNWPEENREDEGCLAWKPAMFMPRWASRINLEITGVRMERVQEISVDDCIAEGIDDEFCVVANVPITKELIFDIARKRFIDLWDSLNARRGYGWDINPWVFVISFKKIDKSNEKEKK